MTIKQTSSQTLNQAAAQTNLQTPIHIVIIGAGLTGLITADLLEQTFKHQNKPILISIFEKSAGVGRLATRYQTPQSGTATASHQHWQFDFGAQFFTAKTSAFQAYLQPWLDSGIIEPWQAVVAELNHDASSFVTSDDATQPTITAQWGSAQHEQPRYISSPKMTTWGRAIAKKLTHSTIHYKTRVAPLTNKAVNARKTTLMDVEDNGLGVFDWVICTAPQAQAIELLQKTDFNFNTEITAPTMLACYTLMLGWQSEAAVPPMLQAAKWSVLDIKHENSDTAKPYQSENELTCLGKVFIEHKKPSRDHILPSVTVHADNNWSQAHVDDDISKVQNQLLKAVQHLLQWDEFSAPAHIDCHRWRYAATKTNPATGNNLAYVDTDKQWLVTGDWCDAGRIESCYKAASQVVEVLAKRYQV